MRVLVLGASSFAAQGLLAALEERGHEVWTFDRARPDSAGSRTLAGPVARFDELVGRAAPVDAVVNFMLLKAEPAEANAAFAARVCRVARQLGAARLIHVSSVSVLPAGRAVCDEVTPAEVDTRHKGEYSRVKIATEEALRAHWPGAGLDLLRPGFILGPGLTDPLVGIGWRLPGQRLLAVGAREAIVPLVDRALLHAAVARCLELPLPPEPRALLLVAPNSPTRGDYLAACCRGLGLARGTLHLPRPVWGLLLLAGSLLLSLRQRRPVNLGRRLRHNFSPRRFEARGSEVCLGLDFRTDWRRLLARGVGGQDLNYDLESLPLLPASRPVAGSSGLCGVVYAGYGRIVRDRHLPALERLGHRGLLEWWDPLVPAGPAPQPPAARRLNVLSEASVPVAVVATPPAARAGFLGELPAGIEAVLFEKPWASHAAEQARIAAALGSGRELYVLHNYRFKPNVQRFLAFLASHNSGRLETVRVHFDSPPVAADGAAWLRRERRARTLLCDYALHFLDLAWLLARGAMEVKDLEVRQNARGETALVEAGLRFENCRAELFLRQGHPQQRCHVTYVFHNYTCRLGFFPDTFTLLIGRETFIDHAVAAGAALAATARQVAVRLGLRGPEPSHATVLAAFLGPDRSTRLASLSIGALGGFYARLHQLESLVYGREPEADERERIAAAPDQIAGRREPVRAGA